MDKRSFTGLAAAVMAALALGACGHYPGQGAHRPGGGDTPRGGYGGMHGGMHGGMPGGYGGMPGGMHGGPGGMHGAGRASERPVVVVDEARGTLAVSPATLSFMPGQKDFDIVWSLPAEGKYRFVPAGAQGGIVVEGEIVDKVVRVPEDAAGKGLNPGDRLLMLNPKQQEIVGCTVSDDRLKATCRNRHTRPGIYKYTLRVSNGDKTIALDPPVINW